MTQDIEYSNCYECGNPFCQIWRVMPSYEGIKQYGSEARVCTNVGYCNLAINLKNVDTWTKHKAVRQVVFLKDYDRKDDRSEM